MTAPNVHSTVRALAPAKVNFDLHVLGRRADGYHLIDSLVAPISLYDTVVLRCRPGRRISLRCSDPGLPRDRRNLAWRAAALALREAGDPVAVEIELTKRIPAGAGLGGGSSDAAAVLLGLDAALGLRLPAARLARLGLEIGADVPFFLRGRPAVIRGVGERVRPVAGFRRRWLVVAWPGFAISTRWAYEALDASLTNRNRPPMIRNSARGRRPLRQTLVNDLETVAVAAHPELQRLRQRLLANGARGALMSGSGSAVFGLYPGRSEALRGAAKLRREGFWAKAVHTLKAGGTVRAR